MLQWRVRERKSKCISQAGSAVSKPARSVYHYGRSDEKTGTTANRTKPFNLGFKGLSEDTRPNSLTVNEGEGIAESAAVFFGRALEIRFKADDPAII